MTKTKIEKGIPLPAPRGQRSMWPFGEMKMGDSFKVPDHKTCNQVSCAMRDYKRKHGGQFTMRKMRDGTLRVWCSKESGEYNAQA